MGDRRSCGKDTTEGEGTRTQSERKNKMQGNKKRVARSGRVGTPPCRGGAVPCLTQREGRQKGGTAKEETQRARHREALHVRHTQRRERGRVAPPANSWAAAFDAVLSRPSPPLSGSQQIWTTHPNRRAPLCALSDASARWGPNRPRPPSPIFGRASVQSQPNRRCGVPWPHASTPVAHTHLRPKPMRASDVCAPPNALRVRRHGRDAERLSSSRLVAAAGSPRGRTSLVVACS